MKIEIFKRRIEMRLFELLLVLSNIGLFALTIQLKKGRRRIPVFVASGIATLLLVIHWTVEGYRVQLFFPYCITSIFLAISGYSYLKKNGQKKPHDSCWVQLIPL
nr:hypothetical protein [Bacillus bingmayongensis]